MQKSLSQSMTEIRRIQSRLGSYPQNSQPFSSTLLQPGFGPLVEKLNPQLNLCHFHPFTENLQYDFSSFTTEVPGQDQELLTQISDQILPTITSHIKSASTQRLSEYQERDHDDERVLNENFSLYRHISELTRHIESQLELGGDSKAEPLLQEADNKAAPDESRKKDTLPMADSSVAPSPDNSKIVGLINQSENLKHESMTVLTKISEAVKELEQLGTPQRDRLPHHPLAKNSHGNAVTIENQTEGFTVRKGANNITNLVHLTESLWNGKLKTHVKKGGLQTRSTETSPGEIGKKKSSWMTAEVENRITVLVDEEKQMTPPESLDDSLNHHLRPRHTLPTQPPAEQTVPSSTPLSSERITQSAGGAASTKNSSGVTNFSFQDVGRLETLKVADALSEYLEEQANLHGDLPL